jgi:hypothetical protein
VRGNGFSAQGSLLQNDGLDDGGAASMETLSRSEKTFQGISWTVAATNANGYTIGLTNMPQQEDFRLFGSSFDYSIRLWAVQGYFIVNVGEGTELFDCDDSDNEMFSGSGSVFDMPFKIQAGDVLGVQVQADQVTYTKNGKIFGRSLTRPTFPLRAGVAFEGNEDTDRTPQSAVGVQITRALE